MSKSFKKVIEKQFENSNKSIKTSNSNSNINSKSSIDKLQAYNLEFFNILVSARNYCKKSLYSIQTVDELFQHFRSHLFKSEQYSVLYAKSLEYNLKLYQIELKINRRNKFPLKIGAIRKSTSCPILNKISCVTTGCVHRCLYTSIQSNVTQIFKNMDFDFDNKLAYLEFRNGLIHLLFDKSDYSNTNSVNSNNFQETNSVDENLSITNSTDTASRGVNRYKFESSLFIKCPIDENLIFELFLQFDKNKDGVIDFGEFVREVKAPICPKRLQLINDVFDKLDFNRDGTLKLADLKYWYEESAKQHPKYLKGEWSVDQVLEKSLSYYELPGEHTGVITREKFIAYYSVISSTIMNDAYFDLLIRKSFNI